MRAWIAPISLLALAAAVVTADRLALEGPPAALKRGLAAFERGELVTAIRQFATAQKYCETDIMARRMLGMSYQNYRWNDEALAQYESVWSLAAQNAALAMRNAGRIHAQRGETAEALDCFGRALAVDPRFAGVHGDLAELHLREGHRQAALEAASRALELEPGNPYLRQLRQRVLASPPPDTAPAGSAGKRP